MLLLGTFFEVFLSFPWNQKHLFQCFNKIQYLNSFQIYSAIKKEKSLNVGGYK